MDNILIVSFALILSSELENWAGSFRGVKITSLTINPISQK